MTMIVFNVKTKRDFFDFCQENGSKSSNIKYRFKFNKKKESRKKSYKISAISLSFVDFTTLNGHTYIIYEFAVEHSQIVIFTGKIQTNRTLN